MSLDRLMSGSLGLIQLQFLCLITASALLLSAFQSMQQANQESPVVTNEGSPCLQHGDYRLDTRTVPKLLVPQSGAYPSISVVRRLDTHETPMLDCKQTYLLDLAGIH